MHPQRTRELIRGKAKRALGRIDEIKPFWIESLYELVRKMHPTKDGKPTRIGKAMANDLIELLNSKIEYKAESS
ncbi:hypothetical protein CW706_06435 [Candidatus Bathyarchaeota archaeon]|nr:MAG: hypothetical protein CW706_06435 [Candidatus Bathyarchaeota archaeon]